MPVDLKRYETLKAAADAAQRDADRAAGQLEAIAGRLKAEFGVADAKAAAKLEAQLAKETAIAESEYEDALADFEKQWGAYLGDA